VIRPATDADARALAELEVRAWRWAYVDIVSEEHMITVDERVGRWTGQDAVAVAEVDGRIAGVVQTGAGGELRALYVEPAAQGAGLGTALYDHAMLRLAEDGYAETMVWVFEADGHARGFFARRGWHPDGTTGTLAGAPTVRCRQNPGA
jgi:GNAT superfamily N-acetyltransferase